MIIITIIYLLELLSRFTFKKSFNLMELVHSRTNLAGWWFASYCLWNSKLCCSRGMFGTWEFFFSVSWHHFFFNNFVDFMEYLRRSSMIEAMMEQLQTCGRVESYSSYCWQATCLLMILMLWTYIKRWAVLLFTAQ